MQPDDPRARLVALAAERGVSLSALSALIGRNTAYLQQFVKKGSPRKLDEADRRKLARFFGVAESELVGSEEKSSKIARDSALLPWRQRPDWVDVPRLDLDASAGPGATPALERAIGAFRFSSAWLRGQGLDPAMLSAIAVAGDSMEPLLADGDEVLVDRAPRPPRDGVHVIRVGDALLVKRLDLGQPGRVALISDNPAYRVVELPRGDVEIIGRVVWKSGRI